MNEREQVLLKMLILNEHKALCEAFEKERAERQLQRIQRHGTRHDKVQIRRILRSGHASVRTAVGVLREFDRNVYVNRWSNVRGRK